MRKVDLSTVFVLFVLLDLYGSMTVPDQDTISSTVAGTLGQGNGIRLSSAVESPEVVNNSDIRQLRERTILSNTSHSLSNTRLADLENDNLTQLLLTKYRERKRLERLNEIQKQILQGLRMNNPPNMSVSGISEEERQRLNVIVRHFPLFNGNNNGNGNDGSTTSALHTTIQKLQSFYPACTLPNSTDKQAWENTQAFRIYYELPISRPSFEGEVTVLLAKVRLYKKPLGDGWELDLNDFQRYNMLDSMMVGRTGAINVFIYQYTKPVKQNRREKKRLVDSKTVILDYEGWVEFNVLTSVNNWFHNSQRNYGLDVEVEDALGNKLNPNLFFRNMNCSSAENQAQDPPFPNIMELHPEMMGENESALFDNETYPTLDLQTADISPSPMADFRLFQPSPFFNNRPANRRLVRKRHLHLHTPSPSHEESQSHCVAEKTYYTFEELNLAETVLYPRGFEWTFCEGTCTSSAMQSASTQTLQSHKSDTHLFPRLGRLWNLLLQLTSRASKCCEAGKKPLHMLFLNESNAVEEITFEEFIPTECSCGGS